MLTDDDLLKIGRLLDERLKPIEQRLMAIEGEVKELRIKVNTMWDAAEKHGLPLPAA